jgi:hypothetical protein
MQTSRWGWNVLALSVIGVSGLAITPFAGTQETPSQQAKAAQTEKPKSEKQDADPSTQARKGVSLFMRMKLDASQKILEGLAMDDFELIQEGAAKLEEMSAAEKWRVTNDAIYREHSNDFQKIARRLAKNAKAGKLEASALTWLEATMQCIECHKWTRANLIANQP